MKICIYDGSIEGFFTAAFMLYKGNITPDIITDEKNIQCCMDTELFQYSNDKDKASRIVAFIKRNTKIEGYNAVIYALNSCKQNKATAVYRYLRLLFKYREKTPYMLNENDVIDFMDISRAVKIEIHRMKGFIRFFECKGDFYYAEYEPDNNVTQFIMPHFVERFSSMPFIIHDIKRNIAGIYNGNEYRIFNNEGIITIYISENEERFAKIWKMYCNTINIESRKNTKLMKNYLPTRYWKHMAEKL